MMPAGPVALRDLSRFQPYFAAYLHLTGGAANTWDFTAWIQARWRDYLQRRRLPQDEPRSRHSADFERWLNGVAFSEVSA